MYPTRRTSIVRILTMYTPSQECHITAHSLLGMQKDNMGALLRSLDLDNHVTYVRGDPSYASLASSFLLHLCQLVITGGNFALITLAIRSTWCGCPIAP